MLAITIFVIGAATVGHLFIGAQTSANYSLDKTQALFLAQEGIERARAIRDVDFNNLVDYDWEENFNGLVELEGRAFDRQVSASCQGEVCDVTSAVEWDFAGRNQNVSLTERLTAWRTPPLDIETETATEIGGEYATLNGNLTCLGVYDRVEVYFQWREKGVGEWNSTGEEEKTQLGTFSKQITGLDPATTYEFRAVAAAETQTKYGDILEFTTTE